MKNEQTIRQTNRQTKKQTNYFGHLFIVISATLASGRCSTIRRHYKALWILNSKTSNDL